MINIKSRVFKILSLLILSVGLSRAASMNDYVNEINSVYHDIGLQSFGKGAYVQIGSNGKIDLKGDYKTYKDFEKAYYIAESIAGVSNVNPAFNVINANIIERPLEKCVAYSMKNEYSKCPNIISYTRALYPTSKKFAIIIAVGKFEGLPPQNTLYPGPENDARLVAKELRKKGFTVEELIDKNATYENVKNAIRSAINALPNNSTLVIYTSTHGSPKTPLGETGAVLYDSVISTYESNNCNYTNTQQINNEGSRDITVVNALASAQKMCYIVHKSLIIARDVLPLIVASGKNINLVVIEDICYSGASFKGIIPDAKTNDVYAPTKLVAKNLVGLDPYPMILLTSASGDQHAQQTRINVKTGELCSDKSNPDCIEHGVFTYYYFTGLPKNNYYLYKTYYAEFNKIVDVSKNIVSRSIGSGESDKPQTPLFISNKNLTDFRL
jgi:Caspase domain.